MTHFEAKRVGLRGLTKKKCQTGKKVLKNIHLLTPIVGIVVSLMVGVPTMLAALFKNCPNCSRHCIQQRNSS